MLKRLESLPLAMIAGGAVLVIVLIRWTTPASSEPLAVVWSIFGWIALIVLLAALIAAVVLAIARRRSRPL